MIFYENVSEEHVCMTSKRIIDIYVGPPFYITFVNLGKVGVSLPKHQKVVEVGSALQEIDHTKDEHFSYPSGTEVAKHKSTANAVSYGPVWGRLEQLSMRSSRRRIKEP